MLRESVVFVSVAQHLKKHSCLTTEVRKILTENTILEHQNNKQKYSTKFVYIYIYIYNQSFLSEYFVDNIFDKQDFIYLHTIKWFQFTIFLVQPCLSQERQNVIHFDIVEHISQTSHLEKSLSDESDKVLHSMRTCLTVQGV